jgi:hypothetical protein
VWLGCFFGVPCLLLLAEYRGFSSPLVPDKLAFVGLWKTSTGYGLDFNANGTVKIVEDYNWRESRVRAARPSCSRRCSSSASGSAFIACPAQNSIRDGKRNLQLNQIKRSNHEK